MYCQHFGLKKKPFQISADNDLLWLGYKHASALTSLKGSMGDKTHCLMALIGDIGTGKTTLINEIIQTLDDETLFVKIENPCLEVYQLFLLIARAFGFEQQYKEVENFSSAFRSFLKFTSEQNRKVLIIVDEAQSIPERFLKEILSWAEFDLNNVLSVILAGQLELQGLLKTGSGQFEQNGKIVQAFLKPLNEGETKAYINKRLEISGTTRRIFLISAIHEAYIKSHGIPRLINIFCDQALTAAFAKNMKIVDLPTIQQVIHELELPTVTVKIPTETIGKKILEKKSEKTKPSPDRQGFQKKNIAVLAMLCLILSGIIVLFYTGYFTSAIKNKLFDFHLNINPVKTTSKKLNSPVKVPPPQTRKVVKKNSPEKITVKNSRSKSTAVHDTGLGYTPANSFQAGQLPAMADKIPANALNGRHPARLDTGLGYTPPAPSTQTRKLPSTVPVKTIKNENKPRDIIPDIPENLNARDLEVFIKEVFLLKDQTNSTIKILAKKNDAVRTPDHKLSESIKFNTEKDKADTPENPAPDAIIDWLMKKNHMKPKKIKN